MTTEFKEIEPEEVEQILSRYELSKLRLEVSGRTVEIKAEDDSIRLVFEAFSPSPGFVFSGEEVYTTVSEYYIYTEDEKYKVKTDGPFHLKLQASPDDLVKLIHE